MITSVLLMMQFVISAKAGFVNYVDGTANVRRQQQVQAGVPIQTQAGSHVELLLSPGSFLRVGENSVVVFDSVELSSIAFHLVSGSAIVESATMNKDFPIKVSSGSLQVSIVSEGLYHFSADTALVLNGKLRDEASGATVKKGHEVIALNGANEVRKLEAGAADELDSWSQMRSGDLAKANLLAYRDRSAAFYNSYADYSTFGMYPLSAAWLYSPFLSGFTFLPFQGYRSFYGYSFVPLTGFGFTPFVPAANRPFPTQTAVSGTGQHVGSSGSPLPGGQQAGHRPGPTAGANSTNAGHWGGNGGHTPIQAGGNTGGSSIGSSAGGSSAQAGGGAARAGGNTGGGNVGSTSAGGHTAQSRRP